MQNDWLSMQMSRDVIMHQGCRLAFGVCGQGVPVLLIQGVGVHGDGWLPQLEALAARHRCLTFDNRGMSRSQPANEQLSIEQMADDALALMNAQGWASAHIIGHSMGGLIAQHLAFAHRARVRSLSLLCTFARGRDATRLTPRMLWLGIRSRIGTRRMRRHAFLQIVMPPAALASVDGDVLAENLAPVFGHDLADQPPIVMRQLSAMNKYDATPRLAELAGLPVLVVSATHDPIARPECGRALAAAIKGSRHVEIKDASHGAPVHLADRINALLLDHLSSADGQPDGDA